MADSDTSSQADNAAPQDIGSVLYDEIMAEIEPELVSANIPGLKEKYANETPQESAVRAERYDRAYEEFDRRLNAREAQWGNEMRRMKREAFASTERDDRTKEQGDLSALDQQIASQ